MTNTDLNLPYRDRIIAAKRALRAQMPDLKERFAALTENITAQVEAIERERAQGLSVLPELHFKDLPQIDAATVARVKQRGALIIRGVFDPERIAGWNATLERYISDNHYIERQKEKAGLDKYFSTGKVFRKSLFYK